MLRKKLAGFLGILMVSVSVLGGVLMQRPIGLSR